MPRRTFGPVPGTTENTRASSTPVASDEHVENSSASHSRSSRSNAQFHNLLSTLKKPFVWIPICAAVVIGSGIGVYTIGFDSGNGGSSPEKAALGFTYASASAPDDVWSYVPKNIRGSKTGSSSVLWELDDTLHVELSNIQTKSVEVDREHLQSVIDGYESFYHQSVKVSDVVSVDISASAKPEDGEAQDIDFDILCVKVGWRWYVYTGADITSDGFDQPWAVMSAAFSDGGSAVQPYDGALDDLKAGKVSIDGEDHVMPSKYQDMTDVFTLVDDAIEKDDRVLTENMILKFLPVRYHDDVAASLTVDIANPDPEDIDLSDGIVTTLQIQKAEDNKPAPDIVLPGNVTFGTSKQDVASVYGSLGTYTGTDADLNSFGYDNSDIYRIRLTDDNDYNWIYFIFDDDDKLSAVEWRYYDLSVIM